MKLNKLTFVILGVLALILIIFILKNNSENVCIGNDCFNVEVVDTPESRQIGLMYREELSLDEGMFFVFENEGNYPFWMKNTLIPLDMIWIDSSGKIVDIKEADPCEADPCPVFYHTGSAKYVLEINKGLSAELGIEIGEIVKSRGI